MNVRYNGPGGFTIDHDASDLQECFGFLGACQELFGAAEVCQNCGKTDIRPKHRHTKGGCEFYSLECRGCKWEFKFGQRKEGGLYPKGWEAPYERDVDQRRAEDAAAAVEETMRQGRDRF